MEPERQKKQHLKYDGSVTIAEGSSRKTVTWKNKEWLWSDLVARLQQTTVTAETVAEYHKMAKSEQDRIKDVGGFVGGSLKGGRRKTDAVAWRQIVTLDADFVKGDIWSAIEMMFDGAGLIYSTHKHTPEKPRVRFVFPLKRPVSPEEYVAIAKRIAADIGIDFFDDTTYQPHRLMYWPSTSLDGEYEFQVQDGPWIDPDEVLVRYNDWRDPLEWPESSRQQQALKKMADRAEDPHSKNGLIGAFCRTYSIEEAIEEFLSERYEKFQENRYTYVDGSTAGGLIIYEDGKFAYSHHGTDPISGLLVNSFDFVRIHLFGDLDEDLKQGTPVVKHPSYTKMNEYAMEIDDVKLKLINEKLAVAAQDFDMDLDEENEDEEAWKLKLELNQYGKFKASAPNVLLILENDPGLKGKIAYDDFAYRAVIRGDLPWRKQSDGRYWQDVDDAGLRNYIEAIYGFATKGKIQDGLLEVQNRNKFHPVREYLAGLEWDGIDRLDTLFIDYLGAADTEYVRTVTRKAFTAAVARVMQPGIKFDYMLTLVGPQGVGKSMILNRMGGEWFSDSLTTVQGKDAYEQLQGAWIIEMAELAATRKAEVESIKQFLTKQVDRFRVSYGRNVSDFPRQCVFFGTTNDFDFLKDRTGNRRFWPVTINENVPALTWRDLDRMTVDQLWAEAKDRYQAKEPLGLSREIEAEAQSLQAKHTEESPLMGPIIEFLDVKLPEDWYERDLAGKRNFLDGDFVEEVGTIQRDRVCSLEIWTELMRGDIRRFPYVERRELNDILRRLPGWVKYEGNKDGHLRFGREIGKQRAFIRMED